MVGYAIRLENKLTDETRLVYATTGIVMRMLERSDDLGSITHLVLDEVHERSLDNDFLLIVLRKLMVRRPKLKVILMSATVDARLFSSYLGGAPIMNVPGRTFPVETKYLEDVVEITEFSQEEVSSRGDQAGDYSDHDGIQEKSANKNVLGNLNSYSATAQKTLAKLDEYRIEYGLVIKLLEKVAHKQEYSSYSRAILVFLPGIAEIRRLSNMIQSHSLFSQGWNICALHSTIATEEQERAFLVPPPGMRKIVLATNIAETGITIPDVTCVIDTGKHKEMRSDVLNKYVLLWLKIP
jgi:ATP-dependent RNA helicase DHX29